MIVGILLAAGSASRFGSQKLLARLPDGRRIVAAAASKLIVACAGNVVAVTRRDPELMDVLAACGCRVVINDHADQGMGSSIAAGVAATPANGWVIALGDMPSIRVDTLLTIVEALRTGARIVVPAMDGKHGHPVGFSALYRARLLSLAGDTGAREILKTDCMYVDEICVDDAGIFLDIDTRADLKLQH